MFKQLITWRTARHGVMYATKNGEGIAWTFNPKHAAEFTSFEVRRILQRLVGGNLQGVGIY